jgi:hypothetical protein
MRKKTPRPAARVGANRATGSEFLGKNFQSCGPRCPRKRAEAVPGAKIPAARECNNGTARAEIITPHEPKNAMFDEASRKPKIKLAAEDGAEPAQQQVDPTNPKPELGGENTKSLPEQIDPAEAAISITKPSTFDLEKFKSKRAAAVASVETLQTALPHHNIAAAKDFVRLHPNETKCWSSELCFVNVPIKGQKRETLHLINEELAMHYLPSARILRRRLTLASKPFDVFFLCYVPTCNLENSWNKSNLQACEVAKTRWTQATSRKAEGVDLPRTQTPSLNRTGRRNRLSI